MLKKAQVYQKDGFVLRLGTSEDVAGYCKAFHSVDEEVARLTGSAAEYDKESVIRFYLKCVADMDRYDFLLVNPEGAVIGESVINEIDWDVKSANFRICIFDSNNCGKGVGCWAVRMTRDFAFEHLHLHRLALDVFSFNPRAEKAYLSAGFKREGVLRDAVKDGDKYGDDILMAILEDEWRARNEIVIRPYAPGDWQRIMEIHDEARQKELALAGLADAFVPLVEAAEREGLFDYTIRVAVVDGSVQGFVAYTEDELAWLYVDPAAGRRGIGTKLTQYVIANTVVRPLCIEVLAGNHAALALYQAMGFEIVDTASGSMPGNESFLVTVNCLEKP